MRRRVRSAIAALCTAALLPAGAAAQQGTTISGRVTSEVGTPLANASVTLEGTHLGTLTTQNGGYSFTVPAASATGQSATLTARLIGYKPSSVTITLSAAPITHNFLLTVNPVQLEGVVVTALGIQRQKRSLGVAQQSVNAEELAQARTPNIVNALDGKVAGVNITNVGPTGGSARIVIRGANSITGNNQPLFVVDGIPIDNSAPNNGGYGGIDYGNTAQDINPNNIASISVLKGANAAALYGSRAANGAIVITTKTGAGTQGLGITASQNLTFQTPLRLPDYQNQYGQGSGGQYEYKDGRGGGISDNVNRSWGPPLDGRKIVQWWSNGQPEPWLPHPNRVRDFFQTGRTSTTNVAVSAANTTANVRLDVTNMDEKGMLPTNTIQRLNTALTGQANLTSKLSATASLKYIRTQGHDRPGTGYDNQNVMQLVTWSGRQTSNEKLSDYINPDGTERSASHTTVDNPFWVLYENPNWDSRDRIIGTASAKYQFTNWLSGSIRSGTDWYRGWRKEQYADGFIGVNYAGGAFFESERFNRETNSDFLLTADHTFGDKLGLTVNFGGNRRVNNFSLNSQGTRHLVIPGTFNIDNSAVTPQVGQNVSNRQTNSLYGQAQFAWNNYLFLNLTGRNDWSSTLPSGNDSYFYPSVSGSFVFTDAFPSTKLGKLLSYGKLRASWTRVGSDADPYQLAVTYSPGTPFGSVPRFSVPNSIPNADLKPEQTRSWEVGTELRFLNDRLALDGTYYNKLTSNQIIPVQVSGASGYTSAVLNAGAISNKGVELQVNATPLRINNFSWDMTVNFARNRSDVTSLYPGIQTVVLGSYWSLTVEARQGEPYGALYGTPYLRDSKGQLILNDGLPQGDPQKRVLGHFTPDWTGGIQNHFRYKDVDFSFLFDTKQGGQLFSATNMFGNMSGVLATSLKGREKAETIANGGGMIVPGVNADGTPNTTKVTAQAYFNSLFQIHEPFVYDASFVKLREVKVGYTFPESLTRHLGVSSLYLALVGRNLWLHTSVPNIDPETAFDNSNAQGLEFGQFPSARSFGFMVNVTP
ncbi:MAG TPA: SusC/RagA family TonB-linked outer membrane protein [Gemmatimonadaceae bacterium]|nr:SusC/RagA family TonB-linked outer membrane protein [Gemmatimonadaceae bacterium]